MNTRAKGRKNEKRCEGQLVEWGYTVQLAPMPQKFSTQNDLFGLWDIIAVSGKRVRFVQVKSNQNANKEWYERARSWQCPKDCTKEVWIYYDRVKDPKIILL